MLDLARGLPSDPVNQLDWFKVIIIIIIIITNNKNNK